MQVLKLKKNREASLKRKHPWVFSGALHPFNSTSLKDGDLVQLVDDRSEILGYGHYHEGSISVKMLDFGNAPWNDDFWIRKIKQALDYRKSLIDCHAVQSNAWRWVHGEADGLPGLIIDRFDQNAVIQCHSIGMHRNLDMICEAIRATDPELKSIYDKSHESLPSEYAKNVVNRICYGTESVIQFQENGILYTADPIGGQKTGFFLDQRENRTLLSQCASGKSVLNTYCYTGGFSLAALRGNARQVISVDVSAKAIDRLEHHLEINHLTSAAHQSVVADVGSYLKSLDHQSFDLIVLDPPAFAKSVAKRHNAIQAYRRLNEAALRKLNSGGLLFTFSCSQVVTQDLFEGAVLAGAIDSGRSVRVVKKLGQAADHPVNIFHPEGHYLKGLLLFVE